MGRGTPKAALGNGGWPEQPREEIARPPLKRISRVVRGSAEGKTAPCRTWTRTAHGIERGGVQRAAHPWLPLLSPIHFSHSQGKRQQDGDTCRRSHRAGRPQGYSLSLRKQPLSTGLSAQKFPPFPPQGHGVGDMRFLPHWTRRGLSAPPTRGER